ncbi:MAG: SGNH/GDSL hydrolase family protein [Pseudomonas sp.]|nr:SGNH/GDSL hydrolase family protein [Pseudomonas sp.]MDP3848451.1 SGNH/GDSL hydrolase family protein [Pseudomonas sp.]
MRLRVGAWWLLALLLLPVLVPQALRTRRRALRLAPAAGPQQGLAGAEFAGPALRVLLLGESTVAGVGVACQTQGLAARLAHALAEQQRRPVAWQACGENGITASQACTRLLPQALAAQADLLLLVFGVNDSTQLSSLRSWRQALTCMTQALQAQGAQVAFTAVPPLQHFSALPWLLRRVLDLRGALLDRQLRAVARQLGASYCPVALEFTADYLAVDGYHPSQLGYQVWASGLAPQLLSQQLLSQQQSAASVG